MSHKEIKIDELLKFAKSNNINLEEVLDRSKNKKIKIEEKTSWDIVKLARHINRPKTMDYIEKFVIHLLNYMEIDYTVMTKL